MGCSVYNPNTDNEKGNDGWLLSFAESLDSVEPTKGFIYHSSSRAKLGEARESEE